MARTGQTLSIVSGFHIAWWGTLVAVACGLSWWVDSASYPINTAYIWFVLPCIGWLGGRVLHKKLHLDQRKGAYAYANRVTKHVWVAIGLSASLMLGVEILNITSFAGRGYFVIFLMCAIGLVATAAAGRESLLLLSAAGWVFTACFTLFFSSSAHIVYMATVVACLVFLVLPGLVIGMRKA